MAIPAIPKHEQRYTEPTSRSTIPHVDRRRGPYTFTFRDAIGGGACAGGISRMLRNVYGVSSDELIHHLNDTLDTAQAANESVGFIYYAIAYTHGFKIADKVENWASRRSHQAFSHMWPNNLVVRAPHRDAYMRMFAHGKITLDEITEITT